MSHPVAGVTIRCGPSLLGFAIFAALAVALQSCGVMTSASDCTQKASCPGPAPADPDDTETGGRGIVLDGSGAASIDGTAGDHLGDATGAPMEREGAAGEAGPGDASGACGLEAEDCTNGVDDNCDGKIDCDDPECAAYACVPPVPAGWKGPVSYAQAASPALPPDCPPGYEGPLAGNAGFDAPAASCATCTCGASGQTCAATVVVDSDTSCNNGCAGAPTTSGACVALPANCSAGASFAANLPPPAISGGTCSPSVAPPTVPPIAWTTVARVCAYSRPANSPGGCALGSQCLLAPSAADGARACVYSQADPAPTSCPPGYDVQGPTTFYQGHADARACSDCTCSSSAPSGGSCSGTVALFSGTSCTGTSTSYTLGAGCQPLSLSPRPVAVMGDYAVHVAGACSAASQPQPIGTATPTLPVTVCCM